MVVTDLFIKAREALEVDPSIWSTIKTMAVTAIDFIRTRYGDIGLLAAFLVTGTMLTLLLVRLATLAFAILRFLVLPALLLAAIASAILDYSFMECLPVTSMACSLLLLMKA
ncbi:MAG TPA: hypothetical protein PLF13_05485 [candidate division Zixibacteria bacterium]|nr:hypothetical protein [candidate division Zixibacteria bacterium]